MALADVVKTFEDVVSDCCCRANYVIVAVDLFVVITKGLVVLLVVLVVLLVVDVETIRVVIFRVVTFTGALNANEFSKI